MDENSAVLAKMPTLNARGKVLLGAMVERAALAAAELRPTFAPGRHGAHV